LAVIFYWIGSLIASEKKVIFSGSQNNALALKLNEKYKAKSFRISKIAV